MPIRTKDKQTAKPLQTYIALRVISGIYRGMKLKGISNETTRPTTDRIRENVFNMLSNMIEMYGKVVLDLFAGTGAYGIESYSRGSTTVIFNDNSKEAVEIIRHNCDSVKLRTQILNMDYNEAIQKLCTRVKFDIIFIDPPYGSDFGIQAIELIKTKELLNTDGVIVFETDKIIEFPGFRVRVKNYGKTRLYFLSPLMKLPR